MPNGGVPINFEFWNGDINLPGTLVVHQQSRMLRLLEITSSGESKAQLLGSVEITRPFLREIVNYLLGNSEDESVTSSIRGDLVLTFIGGELVIESSSKSARLVVSGEMLTSLAAFMAYWVDHDGVEVPTELQIKYLTTVRDSAGMEWNLNWAF